MDEVTAKVKADWTHTLKFKLIFVLQQISNSLGVLGSSGDIIYVDAYVLVDVATAAKDPKSITDLLQDKYQFELKGMGLISFHLGCDFICDDDGTMCMSPKKYIEKLLGTYEHIFGSKPKQNVTSPLEKGDHPELNMSNELDADGIKNYQSLIGAL